MKYCCTCKTEAVRGKNDARCGKCYNIYRREYRKMHADQNSAYHQEFREKERGRNYRRKYWPHLSSKTALLQYNLLLFQQGSKCAMCEKDQKDIKNHLCVDHDHLTGRVRGLLCQPCNSSIGLLQDNLNIIDKARLYLTEQA